MRRLPQKYAMKCLVAAALLGSTVAANHCAPRANDTAPAHLCGARTHSEALRSAVPGAADALPLAGGALALLYIKPERVAHQKARLLKVSRTSGVPLVWVLDSYVGVGNALDAYVRAVLEARHLGRSLIIKSPILRNLCRVVRCAGLETANRRDLARDHRMCLARSHQTHTAHCVYFTTFGWRNGRYPPAYEPLIQGCLTCARRAILRELIQEPGELLQRFLPVLQEAFIGQSVTKAITPTKYYTVALHLRTLDFIEGANATNAAADAWLGTRKARFKWTCLVRRLRALGLGCAPGQRVFLAADSAPVKRAFARAIQNAFPGVEAEYFDGIEPPKYNVWFAKAPSFDDWLSLTTTVADWLALANSRLVIGVKGTTSVQHLPSSFARTASVLSGAPFDDLAGLERDQRSVQCCAWFDHRDW